MKTKLFVSIATSIIIIITLLSGVVFMPGVRSAYADEIRSEDEELTEPYEVLSYKDVFEAYYERASEAVISSGGNICSLDDFTDNYYTYDTNIYEYTEAVIENDGRSEDLSITPLSSGSGEDAPYILKYDKDDAKNRAIYRNFANREYDDEVTPKSAFYRDDIYYKPTYLLYNYRNIREGDILIETHTVLNNIGHTACIYDLDHNSDYGSYIQTIDCVGSGVQFGVLDDIRMIDYQVVVVRHRYGEDFLLDAVRYFHYKQLGKEYNLDAAAKCNRLNTGINSTDWYCSELMYAAYKYAAIPFDQPGHKINGDLVGWWPIDIRNSPSVWSLIDADTAYLQLSIVGKDWNVWSINVTNNANKDVNVYYNKKMCFYDDARIWHGLNDIAMETVAKNSTKEFKVQENWFATAVAFSVKFENQNSDKRLITFADQLNNDKKTLNVCYAMVDWDLI